MNHRSMQEIHIDSLALAAGVISQPHLSVSHARPTRKRRNRRAKQFFRALLIRTSKFFQRLADSMEINSLAGSTAR